MPNPWQEFLKAHGGQGLSLQQMQQLYWKRPGSAPRPCRKSVEDEDQAGSAGPPGPTGRTPDRHPQQKQHQHQASQTKLNPWNAHQQAHKGLSKKEVNELYWAHPARAASAPRSRAPANAPPAQVPRPLPSQGPPPAPLPSYAATRHRAPDRTRPSPTSILDNMPPQSTSRLKYHPFLLPGGNYHHHHKGSSGTPIRGGAKDALFKGWNNRRVFTCARQGCLTTISIGDGKGVGAHIRVDLAAELNKAIGLGGTAVVPLCSAYHDCSGERITLKDTKAILDRNCPLDLRGMRSRLDPPTDWLVLCPYNDIQLREHCEHKTRNL